MGLLDVTKRSVRALAGVGRMRAAMTAGPAQGGTLAEIKASGEQRIGDGALNSLTTLAAPC